MEYEVKIILSTLKKKYGVCGLKCLVTLWTRVWVSALALVVYIFTLYNQRDPIHVAAIGMVVHVLSIRHPFRNLIRSRVFILIYWVFGHVVKVIFLHFRFWPLFPKNIILVLALIIHVFLCSLAIYDWIFINWRLNVFVKYFRQWVGDFRCCPVLFMSISFPSVKNKISLVTDFQSQDDVKCDLK